MRISAVLLAAFTAGLFPTGALAQQVPVKSDGLPELIDQEIRMLRKDLKSARKQIVASNMVLTDTEAEQFWPVYTRFADEVAKLGDSKLLLIGEYIRNYGVLTSAQAERYLNERAAAEMAAIQLRLRYIPIFRKVLSAKATALFFQVEWRVNLMIELQMASEVPLIEARVSVPAKQVQ